MDAEVQGLLNRLSVQRFAMRAKKGLCTRGCRGYSERNSHSPPKSKLMVVMLPNPSSRSQVGLESRSSQGSWSCP
jgi:hypothetical protein